MVTEEDRNRNVYYSQQQEFGAEVRRAASLEEFMASLDLRVVIQSLGARKACACRAINATNQSVQPDDYSPHGSGNPVARVTNTKFYTAEVSDRFGDYGLVGVVICRHDDAALIVDTFLLSCRVLGRGVEHRIAAFLGQTALSRGLSRVVLPYRATKKNSPARDFLESIDFAEVQRNEDGFILSAPASLLATLRWMRPKTDRDRREAGQAIRRNPSAGPSTTRISPIILRARPRFCNALSASHIQTAIHGVDDGDGRTVGPDLGRSAGAPLRSR